MNVWIYDDGGRADAGLRGYAGDCAVRGIAIATERPYREVYDELGAAKRAALVKARSERRRKALRGTARNGTPRDVIRSYLADRGWVWTPTMAIGSGTRVHLRADELPGGRLIVSLSRHLCAVVDGVVHDTFDPTRDGERCVYGIWSPP
jgi:hypothetical protein